MNENAQDNDALFRSTRHKQETPTPSAPASWLNAPQVGWTAQQDAKRSTLSNSREGKSVNGVFIVGGSARIQGRL
jgi:hypothetical protein